MSVYWRRFLILCNKQVFCMFPCSKKIKSLNAVTALCLKLCYDWIKFRLQHFGFASQETRSQETVSYYETQPSDVLHPCCWPVIYSLSCKGTKGRPFPSLYVVTSARVLWWILVHCVHLKEKKRNIFAELAWSYTISVLGECALYKQ